MALRAVFDRTPREAPKFLSLRGLRAFSLFLRVKNLLACGRGESPDVGRSENRPPAATGRGSVRRAGLVAVSAALGVLRASSCFICDKILACLAAL
jgi:hypothetical protein